MMMIVCCALQEKVTVKPQDLVAVQGKVTFLKSPPPLKTPLTITGMMNTRIIGYLHGTMYEECANVMLPSYFNFFYDSTSIHCRGKIIDRSSLSQVQAGRG
jgi:hypothetical protein